MAVEITHTLNLGHCWICLCRDSDGNKLHSHHCVPVASGGIDGPTVTLCSSHHSAIHDAALRCYPNRLDRMNKWLEVLPVIPGCKERFYYLVNVIIRSRDAVSEDTNKRNSVSVSLSGADNRLLNSLCDQLSTESIRRMTRPECMLYAMKNMAARLGVK